MVKSDTTNRYNGIIQRCEDDCGLGPTGITANSDLYSRFIGWLNQWNKLAANWAIMSWDGADFDDIGYSTAPHGTFTGTTNRDYNFDEAYKMLKLKIVNVSYDGTNYRAARAFDAADKAWLATKDPNVDTIFSTDYPKYDLRAQGFDLYPKFTSAQVALGANIYVEWFRAPRDFDTSSGTDSYEPCLDLQFHHLISLGASFEYCKLYKPEAAAALQGDLYGARTSRGQLIRKGLIDEAQAWYNSKSPSRPNLKMNWRKKT